MNDQPQRGKRKSPEQHRKLARLLAEEVPVGQALMQAGWTELQARKGWESVPNGVIATLPKKMKRLVELGKTDKETRRNLIRGRLVDNITRGKDGGSMSAKILGSDTELNLWTPDVQMGLVVLTAPQAIIHRQDEMLKAED